MNRINYIRKTILYTILISPVIILGLEFSSQLFYKLRFGYRSDIAISKKNKNVSNTIYDPITGWRHNCDYSLNNKQLPSEVVCDKHGLIKTPHASKGNNKDIFGVLLLGNSVAMGEGVYSKNNNKSFASELEYSLRAYNSNIDLVNGAYSGYNSWQEHLEAVRYINSEPLFDDLPSISLIVSFGGIQDFWSFLRLLVNKEIKTTDEYRLANGLMINSTTIDFINRVTGSYYGDISSGFNSFLTSILLNSKLYLLTNNFINNNLFIGNNIDYNQMIIEVLPDDSYEELTDIIIKRLSITPKEYYYIRDYFVSYVVRNIRSNSILLENGKYVYVYAPTYFSTLSRNPNVLNASTLVKGIGELIDYNEYQFEIYERELHILEKDYRNSLLTKLSSLDSLVVLNYAEFAKDVDWFIDYSHFNEFASSSLAKSLAVQLMTLVNSN